MLSRRGPAREEPTSPEPADPPRREPADESGREPADPPGREPADPPGAVSDQNGEEAERGHRTATATKRPDREPGNDGGADRGGSEHEAGRGGSEHDGGADRPAGAAGEGTQSTGHPGNAG